jgi:RNA polymerase sigma factor (TIGR02999 family)
MDGAGGRDQVQLSAAAMSEDPPGGVLAELRAPSSPTLFPLLYTELRRVARRHLALERPGHTLQATALVHEVYLRLVPQTEATWEDRGKFVGIAAHVMRQILVEHARSRGRLKRGGGAERLPLEEDVADVSAGADRWEELDRALDRLAGIDPRRAKVVELRYFGGMTVEEAARTLGVSEKTVKRDWSFARAWLRRELGV